MAQKELKLSLKWLPPFLGSGPGKGRSPVEWGETPSIRPYIRPPEPLWQALRQALKPYWQFLRTLLVGLRPLHPALRPLLLAL